jgi:hypothetical protein
MPPSITPEGVTTKPFLKTISGVIFVITYFEKNCFSESMMDFAQRETKSSANERSWIHFWLGPMIESLYQRGTTRTASM